jgi:Rrf2 family protein
MISQADGFDKWLSPQPARWVPSTDRGDPGGAAKTAKGVRLYASRAFDKGDEGKYNKWVKVVQFATFVAEEPRTTPMQLSRRADYGVRLILDLAMQPQDTRSSTQEIAARQSIPLPFLAKIISQLSLAGLVVTFRGAGGGVTLARPATDINLLQVVEALDGPIALNRCLLQPGTCPREDHCPVHETWQAIQHQLATALRETSFAQLAKRESSKLAQQA